MITQIERDIIVAMKSKDTPTVNSLRYVKSLLLENNKAVKPKETLEVILSYKKILEKSLEIYADYPVELAKVHYDLALLAKYLPVQMSEEEVKSAILEIKSNKNISEFSQLMKESMATLKGKVDGKTIASLVKQLL